VPRKGGRGSHAEADAGSRQTPTVDSGKTIVLAGIRVRVRRLKPTEPSGHANETEARWRIAWA